MVRLHPHGLSTSQRPYLLILSCEALVFHHIHLGDTSLPTIAGCMVPITLEHKGKALNARNTETNLNILELGALPFHWL